MEVLIRAAPEPIAKPQTVGGSNPERQFPERGHLRWDWLSDSRQSCGLTMAVLIVGDDFQITNAGSCRGTQRLRRDVIKERIRSSPELGQDHSVLEGYQIQTIHTASGLWCAATSVVTEPSSGQESPLKHECLCIWRSQRFSRQSLSRWRTSKVHSSNGW